MQPTANAQPFMPCRTPVRSRPIRFGVRALLAVTSGTAFVAFLIGWLLRTGESRSSLLPAALWAASAMTGIIMCARYEKSILLGSLAGGSIAALLYYGGLLVMDLNNVRMMSWSQTAFGLMYLLCMAGSASGVLAVIVGVLLEGFMLKKSND
jgi:hypothetical protein